MQNRSKKTLLIILTFIVLKPTLAQDSAITIIQSKKISRHAMFFEIAGKSIIYSFNYEYTLTSKVKSFTPSINIGCGYFDSKYSNFNIPYALNLNLGQNKHKIEIGIGQTLTIEEAPPEFLRGNTIQTYTFSENDVFKSQNVVSLYNNLSFGYKRMPSEGGIYFKVYALFWFAPIKISRTNYEIYDSSSSIPLDILNPRHFSDFIADNKLIPYLGMALGYCFGKK